MHPAPDIGPREIFTFTMGPYLLSIVGPNNQDIIRIMPRSQRITLTNPRPAEQNVDFSKDDEPWFLMHEQDDIAAVALAIKDTSIAIVLGMTGDVASAKAWVDRANLVFPSSGRTRHTVTIPELRKSHTLEKEPGPSCPMCGTTTEKIGSQFKCPACNEVVIPKE